jgi:poly(beta-D-mannuronate) lyase
MRRLVGAACVLVIGSALVSCSSSTPEAGGSGGSGAGTGGAVGSGGTGGGSSGTGGSTADGGAPGSGGSSGGDIDAGQGGTGGEPSADAAIPPEDGGSSDSEQLPPCKKTTRVASSAELGPAVTAAQPGDCLVLADGNYTFPTITKTATEAAPIVIRAENRGKAVVNSGVLHLLNSQHVVVEGLDITSAGASSTFENGGSNGMLVAFTESQYCRLTRTSIHPGGAPVDRDWIIITGEKCDHNRIDHNDLGPLTALANMLVINGSGQEEPLIPGQVCQYNRVDHNNFHDIHYSGGNNWEAMRIGRSWMGPTKGFNVIEHNFLKAADGDPETISLKSSDNIVRHNTMRATAGEICLRHGNRNQIYGNYILADGNGGSRGIRVYGADHRIFNNYVAASSTGIWLDDGASAAMDEPGKEHYQVYRAWVFNNTVVGKPIEVGGSKAYSPKDCRIANNIVIGAGVNPGGSMVEGNITGTNPLTMQDGIYRLLANAAGAGALGKAVNTAFYGLVDDIDGQPRSEPDVGADEQSSAPVTTPGPISATDVGPDAP